MLSIKIDKNVSKTSLNGHPRELLAELCTGVSLILMEISRENEYDFKNIKQLFVEVMRDTTYDELKNIFDKSKKRKE